MQPPRAPAPRLPRRLTYSLQARLAWAFNLVLLPAVAAIPCWRAERLCLKYLEVPGAAEPMGQLYRGVAMAQ